MHREVLAPLGGVLLTGRQCTRVVASGQFLLDSEASLTGIEVREIGAAQ